MALAAGLACLLTGLARSEEIVPAVAGAQPAAAPAIKAPAAPPKVDFGRDIQPILARRCYACHGPDKAESGLRLNARDTALGQLDSGERAVVPGKADESELLRRVSSTDDDERMPPKDKPLSAEQIELLRRWIAEGAVWNEHWAFQPLRAPAPPAVKDQSWPRGDIDRFILSRLEEKELPPAPPAASAALLRRAYYDLTGLPPTPAEVDAFLADPSPTAYAQVIDRLLASPHYGERWARHWLDVVRYADTNSFERDGVKPHAWRYRDYVIRSLNADKPYDQFLREQLAGDELPKPTAETIIATGFYRIGVWDDEPADRMTAHYDELDDILTTTSQTVMALTLNCARCHDHKLDPLTQRDYYQMIAFFQGLRGMAGNGPNIETQIFDAPLAHDEYTAEQRELEAQYNDVQRQISELGQALVKRFRETAPPIRPAKSTSPTWKTWSTSSTATRSTRCRSSTSSSPRPRPDCPAISSTSARPRATRPLALCSAAR